MMITNSSRNKIFQIISTTVILLFLVSCTHLTTTTTVNVAQGIDIPLQLPQQHGTVIQKVTGTFRNQTHLLIMQIELQADNLAMAGLTPTGTRLFSVNFDGQNITSWQSPLFNAPFDGAYILADFELTTLDLASLQHILPNAARVTENTQAIKSNNTVDERIFYNGAGKAIINIRYSNPINHTDGNVDYCHLERNYCLHIETLPGGEIP